jgi:hypothetical protein
MPKGGNGEEMQRLLRNNIGGAEGLKIAEAWNFKVLVAAGLGK